MSKSKSIPVEEDVIEVIREVKNRVERIARMYGLKDRVSYADLMLLMLPEIEKIEPLPKIVKDSLPKWRIEKIIAIRQAIERALRDVSTT